MTQGTAGPSLLRPSTFDSIEPLPDLPAGQLTRHALHEELVVGGVLVTQVGPHGQTDHLRVQLAGGSRAPNATTVSLIRPAGNGLGFVRQSARIGFEDGRTESRHEGLVALGLKVPAALGPALPHLGIGKTITVRKKLGSWRLSELAPSDPGTASKRHRRGRNGRETVRTSKSALMNSWEPSAFEGIRVRASCSTRMTTNWARIPELPHSLEAVPLR